MGVKYAPNEPRVYQLLKRTDVDVLTVPRGHMNLLRELFDKHHLDYEVLDKRSAGDAAVTGSFEDPWQLQGGVKFPEHKLVMWPHQDGIVAAIQKYEQALIRAPTGSGKTSAMLKAISVLGVPALVIMWDTGLLDQWQRRIEVELGIPKKEQGLIQGSTYRLRGLTLAMQQTMNNWDDEKWERIRSVFGFVGFDEVQRYAARTFLDTADRFDAKYRVGVSADERRKDGKQFLVYSMFGQVRHEVPKKDLIEKRIIHDVEVFVVPTDFVADWYAEKREDKEQAINGQDFNLLLDAMQADVKRNELVVGIVDQCVKEGLPTLTFTHRVDHAKLIDSQVTGLGHTSGLALGGEEWREQFALTIDSLRAGTCMVGCGTFGKLGVGHDIPTVAAGVAVTPVHNNRAFMEQVKGRICRTSSGKQNARIFVLWDRFVFGQAPLYNLKRWNENVRVWDLRELRWKTVDQYLKEHSNDRPAGEAQAADGLKLFDSAQRR